SKTFTRKYNTSLFVNVFSKKEPKSHITGTLRRLTLSINRQQPTRTGKSVLLVANCNGHTGSIRHVFCKLFNWRRLRTRRPKLGSTLPVGSVRIKCTAWKRRRPLAVPYSGTQKYCYQSASESLALRPSAARTTRPISRT